MPTVNFQAPDQYSTDQAAIERSRKYAELLREQSLQPMETKMAGGWAIPNSPMEGAAKLFQAYLSKSGMDEADAKQKALGEKYRTARSQELAAALRAGQGTPASTENIVDETANGGEGAPAQINAPAVPGSRQAMIAALANSPFPDFQQAALQQSLAMQKPTVVGAGATVLGPDNKPVFQAPNKPAQVTVAGPNGMPMTQFVTPDPNAAPLPQPVKQTYLNTGDAQTPVTGYVNPSSPAAPLPIKVNPNTQFRVDNRVVTETPKFTNVQPDGQGGYIGLSKATGKIEKIPQDENVTAGGQLTGDALELAAKGYLMDRKLPTNLGRGQQGAMNTVKIISRAAEMAKESGMTNDEAALNQILGKAKTSAITQVTKDLAAIRPYKAMLEKNGDIAVDLAQKAIATNSRLANKTVNWLRQNAGDNPDVAEFLAQAQIVTTEAARVLNNPRLVGQLTDSARHEMEGIINGDMPLQSFTRVVRRMQSDGRNRVEAMEKEIGGLQSSLSNPNGRRSTDKARTVIKFDAQGNMIQ